jgi:hypothetical protein
MPMDLIIVYLSIQEDFLAPRQIFEKLVNKNAIKPKIGAPLAIFCFKP